MKGAFTKDTFLTRCYCGEYVHLLRRGPVVLLPAGHHCDAKETQDNVLRTVKAEESCGIRITPREVARRLRDWGVGAHLSRAGVNQ